MNDWLWRPARLRRWEAVALGAIGLAASAALLWPLLHGGWYMMDDPTILSWLRVDGRLHLADVPHILATSEIAAFGSDSRCRPVYWILRLAETALWGDRTTRWFGVRILLFGGVLSAFAWTLVAAVGRAWGAVLMVYVAAQFYWGDVWAHASLGEQYAAGALAVFVVAAAVLLERFEREAPADGPLIAMSVATIVAVGSKENFAFLVLPLAIALLLAHRAGLARRRAAAAVAAAFAMTAYVGAGVILGLRHEGMDQYGASAGLSHRLGLLAGGLPLAIGAGVAGLAAGAATLRSRVRRRRPGALAGLDRLMAEQGVLALIVVAMLLVQVVYYDGDWPRFGGRYDFPGRLAEVVVAASAIVAMRGLIRLGLLEAAIAWACGVLLVASVIWSVARHGFNARADASHYAAESSQMRAAVRAVIARYAGDSTVPVVLESRDPGDYEAAVWTATVMPFYGGRNPVFLRPPVYAAERPGADSLVQRRHALQMARMAGEGAPEFRLRPFTAYPAALERASGRCVSLLLRPYEPMIPVRCTEDAPEGRR